MVRFAKKIKSMEKGTPPFSPSIHAPTLLHPLPSIYPAIQPVGVPAPHPLRDGRYRTLRVHQQDGNLSAVLRTTERSVLFCGSVEYGRSELSLSLWGGTSNCGLPLCAVLSPKLVHPLFCSEELGITGRSSRHQLRTRRTGQDSADSAKSMLPTQPRRCGTFGTDGQTQRSSPSTWHLGLSLGTWCHRGTSKREEATTVQPCAGLMGRLPSKVRPYTL